jgi:hypothetical protein
VVSNTEIDGKRRLVKDIGELRSAGALGFGMWSLCQAGSSEMTIPMELWSEQRQRQRHSTGA